MTTNIGVLFRNNEKLVVPFFFFLRKSMSDNPLRVFALDNGSSDSTLQLIKSNLTEKDVLITSQQNRGISKGRNIILNKIREVSDEYQNLILLDSDVFIARRYSFDNMIKMLEDNDAGVVFGRTIAFDPQNVGFTENSNGYCFVLINKKVFDVCGVFDERYEMFYDDTDLDKRIIDSNMSRLFCAESFAIHAWGSTVTSGSEKSRREQCTNDDKKRYNEKWGIKT